jgi:cell division inhibitor SepF
MLTMSDGLRGRASRARRVVRRAAVQEGETMSALHRLKAYFGMVPVEDFDAAAGFDDYHVGYSGYPDSGAYVPGHNQPGYEHQARHNLAERPVTHRPHRAAFDNYDGSFPTPAGQHAAPRMHPARSPSSSPDPHLVGSRTADSWATEPWGTDAPVHGSLAIDTATADAAHIENRPTARQPVAPQPFTQAARSGPFTSDEVHPLSRIVTLHPHSYNEARPIGERYREGNPVIMNLTAMEDRDAKRLVDFAAGLAFALRGSIDKVTNKVFLLSPPNLDVSAEDRRRIAEGRYFA